MARVLKILERNQLLQVIKPISIYQIKNYSTNTKKWSTFRKILFGSVCILAGGSGLLAYTLDQAVKASGNDIEPPYYNWPHTGVVNALDHASIRRGYFIYKQVCSACHSIRFLAYRELVGVIFTEEEARAEAAGVTVKDGPNDAGEYFERPGKLSDCIPSPYPNAEAARAANNGNFPVDLSYVVAARERKEDYVFSLLTGYCDTPTGVTLREGQYYNPYFPNGAISMAPPLYTDVVEYEDGTKAHTSQLAKDVATFLVWTSQPEHDDRKLMLIRCIMIYTFLIGVCYYVQRFKWTVMKSRKILLKPTRSTQKRKVDPCDEG